MKDTRLLVFCALMTAMSLILLYAGVLFPSGRVGLCAAASLPASVATIRFGLRGGIFTWLTSSVLALILLPTPGTVLLYVLVFGLYAPLRELFQGLGKPSIVWLCKLLFCACLSSLFVLALPTLLAESIELPDWGAPLLIAAAVALFAIYDLALSRLLKALAKINPHDGG